MIHITHARFKRLTLAACCLSIAGCAAGPKPLYEWGGYQAQVYQHLKTQGSAPEQQIATLQADLEKARAKGMTPPPGFHAHLGMLYAQQGQDDQALQALLTEKTLFPESTTYIDFLLAKIKK